MPEPPIRLLVIANVYRPDLGGGVLFADLCEGLAEENFDVTVKCAYSYYPEWENKSGQNGWFIRSTREHGVMVERYGLYIPSNPNSLLQRLLYETSFYLSLRRRLPDKQSVDAILVICPLIGAVAYAAAVKRRTGAPLWLNVQDLSAQAAAAGGITRSSFVTNLLVRFQNRLFAKANIWSSISAPMVDVLKSHQRKGIPVELIPNWLHRSLSELIEEHARENEIRKGPIRLLYSGNIGTKQDLLAFCKYLHATRLDFQLCIQGNGGRAPELTAFLSRIADPRFEIRELSDERGLVKALTDADYYLITEKKGSGSAFIPSKLIPALATGTPILAVCDADSPFGNEMIQFAVGPRLDWLNLDALDSVFSPEARESDQYELWRANARARSVFYRREQGIARCANLIRNLIQQHKAGP